MPADDATLMALRRPITCDETAFWYTSLAKWHNLLAEARDKSDKLKHKAAWNSLRKLNMAGRVMETDEGGPAPAPCRWCLRTKGTASEIPCRVLVKGDAASCAYCCRMGKAHCTAKKVASTPTGRDEYATVERVSELEVRLARLEALLRKYGRGSPSPVKSDGNGGQVDGDIDGDADFVTHEASHDGSDTDMRSGSDAEDDNIHVKGERDDEDVLGGDERGPGMYQLNSFRFDPERKAFELQRAAKSLGLNDVLVKTSHSGLCQTDVHAKEKGCGLGHEGVGTIEEVGQAVTSLKVGERVGWGWLHSSCGNCTTCVTGYRQYCAEARGFAFSDLDQGAFGDYRIINSAFAYRIPDAISSVNAGPLMCAGASVYEALDAAGVKSTDRVGVVGIGGLGHIAILFSKAMGCGITALSSAESKLDDALELGSDEYRLIHDAENCYRKGSSGDYESHHDPQPRNINVLLITSNEVPALETIMPLLARRATIVLMTIQTQPLTLPYMPFVLPGHRLIASTEASRENHIKMLEFAARHQIQPWTEEFSMTAGGIAKAFDRLERGQMRYRGVLLRPDQPSPLSSLASEPL